MFYLYFSNKSHLFLFALGQIDFTVDALIVLQANWNCQVDSLCHHYASVCGTPLDELQFKMQIYFGLLNLHFTCVATLTRSPGIKWMQVKMVVKLSSSVFRVHTFACIHN